ncbi:hypothetical protein RCL1_002048 [Eukaryota sp. TZLM3-RCL]
MEALALHIDKNRFHRLFPTIDRIGNYDAPATTFININPDEAQELRSELHTLHEALQNLYHSLTPYRQKCQLHSSTRVTDSLTDFGALSDYEEHGVPPSKRKRKTEKLRRSTSRAGMSESRPKPPRPKADTPARKEKKEKEPENPQVKALNKDIDTWLGVGIPHHHIQNLLEKYRNHAVDSWIPEPPPKGMHYAERWKTQDDQHRQELIRLLDSIPNADLKGQLLSDDQELSIIVTQPSKPELYFPPEVEDYESKMFNKIQDKIAPKMSSSLLDSAANLLGSAPPRPQEEQSLISAHAMYQSILRQNFENIERARNSLKSKFDWNRIIHRNNLLLRWDLIESQIKSLSGGDSKKKTVKSVEEVARIYVNKMIKSKLVTPQVLETWQKYRPELFKLYQNHFSSSYSKYDDYEDDFEDHDLD